MTARFTGERPHDSTRDHPQDPRVLQYGRATAPGLTPALRSGSVHGASGVTPLDLVRTWWDWVLMPAETEAAGSNCANDGIGYPPWSPAVRGAAVGATGRRACGLSIPDRPDGSGSSARSVPIYASGEARKTGANRVRAALRVGEVGVVLAVVALCLAPVACSGGGPGTVEVRAHFDWHFDPTQTQGTACSSTAQPAIPRAGVGSSRTGRSRSNKNPILDMERVRPGDVTLTVWRGGVSDSDTRFFFPDHCKVRGGSCRSAEHNQLHRSSSEPPAVQGRGGRPGLRLSRRRD